MYILGGGGGGGGGGGELSLCYNVCVGNLIGLVMSLLLLVSVLSACILK